MVVATTNMISIAKNQLTAIETTAIDFQHDHAAVGVRWGRLVSTPAHEALVQLTKHFSTLFLFFRISYFLTLPLSPSAIFIFYYLFAFSSFLGEECRKMPVRQIYNHHARKMLWREQQQPVVVVLQNVQLFFLFFFNDSRGYGKVNVHTHTQVMSLLHAVTFFPFLLRDPLFLPSFARRLVYTFVRSSLPNENRPPPAWFFLLFFSVPDTKRTKRITSKKKPHRRLLSTSLSHFCNGRLSKTWPRNQN